MMDSQRRLLIHLASFKYLNSDHMTSLKIATRQYMSQSAMPPIRDNNKPLIKRQIMPVIPQIGRKPDVYYLTSKGVEFLEDELDIELENIRFPIAHVDIAPSDYIHRMATIDIHVELYKWLGPIEGEICKASAYFDKKGSQRKKNQVIPNRYETGNDYFVIPDLVTHFQVNGEDKIIAWEQHNGKDTKKLIAQVLKHIYLLKSRDIGKRHGFENKLHRVGIVFEYESIMFATMKRLNEEYGASNALHRCFIFKTNNQIKQNFEDGWLLWNNTTTDILS